MQTDAKTGAACWVPIWWCPYASHPKHQLPHPTSDCEAYKAHTSVSRMCIVHVLMAVHSSAVSPPQPCKFAHQYSLFSICDCLSHLLLQQFNLKAKHLDRPGGAKTFLLFWTGWCPLTVWKAAQPRAMPYMFWLLNASAANEWSSPQHAGHKCHGLQLSAD